MDATQNQVPEVQEPTKTPGNLVQTETTFDPENPRSINEHDFNALQKSLEEFGDLSCIVFNQRLGLLVGGHQRVRAMQAKFGDAPITVSQLEQPSATGTVAVGYVEAGGDRYKFRVVDWDQDKHRAGNVAANRIQGEFEETQLADYLQKMSEDARALTGHTERELKRLQQLSSAPEEPEDEEGEDDKPDEETRLSFAVTNLQSDAIRRALDAAKVKFGIQSDITKDANGEALYLMAQEWLAGNGGGNVAASPPPGEIVV